MAPPKKKAVPSGPTPVEAFVHEAKRANLPTSDAQEFITPEIEAPVTVTYPREISSPMLVWQGKEAQDASDLTVDAPPIYIRRRSTPGCWWRTSAAPPGRVRPSRN